MNPDEVVEKAAIQQQLTDLRLAVEANTLTQNRRIRWQWAALGAGLILLMLIAALGC